jgi:hypothetical protein
MPQLIAASSRAKAQGNQFLFEKTSVNIPNLACILDCTLAPNAQVLLPYHNFLILPLVGRLGLGSFILKPSNCFVHHSPNETSITNLEAAYANFIIVVMNKKLEGQFVEVDLDPNCIFEITQGLYLGLLQTKFNLEIPNKQLVFSIAGHIEANDHLLMDRDTLILDKSQNIEVEGLSDALFLIA